MDKDTKDTLESQAVVFGHYLLGKPVHGTAAKLYAEILLTQELPVLGRQDKAALLFAVRHPWSLGLLDAGLSLLRPNAELCRRLFILFSILESQPEYWENFLPQARSGWYLATVFLTGCKAVLKAVLGCVLVRVVAG
jgi:hypothetical protein